MKKYVLAIDQGTTGSRAFLYNDKGKVVASAYKEFTQYFPFPGWVEHDAEEIWGSCVSVIRSVCRKSKINKKNIISIGITNQRETTVIWDKRTSKPVAKAIVWQCRRTTEICKTKNLQKHKKTIQKKTGLLLDPYFSGTKVKWLLDHKKGLRKKCEQGTICFGTIDSWLIWKLTGGKNHVTDMTNASRTMLFNICQLKWDQQLLDILDVPQNILPSVQPSGSVFGYTSSESKILPKGIPISAVMGDQQSALYGQGCFQTGTIKNTYGTGCFVVLNTGKKIIYSKKGLLTTIACDSLGKPVYALEGSIFIGGAVIQWLRDQLGIITKASDSERLVKNTKDTNGVYFIPAFIGLGAPYWDSEVRGSIVGLTRGSNKQHITRAALESIAYQTKDVIDIMKDEFGKKINKLKVDGGACHNDFLMQFQSDILGCQILKQVDVDSTVQGVAHLAGVTIGLWKVQRDLTKFHKTDKVFKHQLSLKQRKDLYTGWQNAVKHACMKI